MVGMGALRQFMRDIDRWGGGWRGWGGIASSFASSPGVETGRQAGAVAVTDIESDQLSAFSADR